ncbi:MAG: hypothetical protein HUU32_04460 [Calditrichaceae bacterium]|nr:hypothetical protein [Calditrichia bacterium]NUQ40627.1 hypothetical protein [Calditrichaceae bacterium]
MKKTAKKEDDQRMIHVRLTEEIHKRLRIRVAELDTSIQEWVADLITKELNKKSS